MYTPPPQVNPDEHLMQERARQDALDADDRRGRSRRGRKILSKGDVWVFTGVGIVMTLAVLLFFVFLW